MIAIKLPKLGVSGLDCRAVAGFYFDPAGSWRAFCAAELIAESNGAINAWLASAMIPSPYRNF